MQRVTNAGLTRVIMQMVQPGYVSAKDSKKCFGLPGNRWQEDPNRSDLTLFVADLANAVYD